LSDFVFVLRAHISNITHAGYAACESLHSIIKLTYDFVNSLYEPLDFGASHCLIIISDFSLVKEEKMFRYLNIFCNYLVEISNRGDGLEKCSERERERENFVSTNIALCV
jgi:hypothetical protein